MDGKPLAKILQRVNIKVEITQQREMEICKWKPRKSNKPELNQDVGGTQIENDTVKMLHVDIKMIAPQE